MLLTSHIPSCVTQLSYVMRDLSLFVSTGGQLVIGCMPVQGSKFSWKNSHGTGAFDLRALRLIDDTYRARVS